MNGYADNKQQAEESDDVFIEQVASVEEDPIDAGAYLGRLVKFKQEEKPPWKIEQQKVQNPEKTVDELQWAFTFEITEGDYAGRRLTTWENRSPKWHERANATKIVCALLNLTTLEGYQGSTKQLIGLVGQLFVTEKNGRNYIDKVLPAPRRKARTQQGQAVTPKDIPQLRPTFTGDEGALFDEAEE